MAAAPAMAAVHARLVSGGSKPTLEQIEADKRRRANDHRTVYF